MTRLLANPRFLAIYSGVLTAVFAITVFFGLTRSALFLHVSAAEAARPANRVDFDQLTVHRINIVEPDGTPRLILADKAEYPGSFFHGKEVARPDRNDSAGMLFINEEGSENGGMLFGGYKSRDGVAHSWGHLSFDEYEQDQYMDIDASQDGSSRSSKIVILDNPAYPITPAFVDEAQRVKAMPHGPARAKAWAALLAKYPPGAQRAYLGRTIDNDAKLELSDQQGRTRIQLRVAPDGTPTMQFLDAQGKVTHQWPEK
jgi:hypothetical protein